MWLPEPRTSAGQPVPAQKENVPAVGNACVTAPLMTISDSSFDLNGLSVITGIDTPLGTIQVTVPPAFTRTGSGDHPPARFAVTVALMGTSTCGPTASPFLQATPSVAHSIEISAKDSFDIALAPGIDGFTSSIRCSGILLPNGSFCFPGQRIRLADRAILL